MKNRTFLAAGILACMLLASCATAGGPGSTDDSPLPRSGAPFPRIANLYGSGFGGLDWASGGSYWRKLDLIIGGGYDFHNDWNNPDVLRALPRVRANLQYLREANPEAIVVAYSLVSDGQYNPDLPDSFWKKDASGNRMSRWPGSNIIATDNPDVIDYAFKKSRELIFDTGVFDGVFYDGWAPDARLAGRASALSPGLFLVMTNPWNLPEKGYQWVNGVLSEDELNRVVDGTLEFEKVLKRYIGWTKRSLKPAITTMSCHPRTVSDDPWRWANLSNAERTKETADASMNDLPMMRFGLALSLMGDGYFAYDLGAHSRGAWWWYLEYDAPLGYPLGDAERRSYGFFTRQFDGGLVCVNGSRQEKRIEFNGTMKDYSMQTVGTEFVIPPFDGRIFVPVD
jgi:hypothetical protein